MFAARTVVALVLGLLITGCGKPGDTQEPRVGIQALSVDEETELRLVAEGVFAVLPDVMPGNERMPGFMRCSFGILRPT